MLNIITQFCAAISNMKHNAFYTLTPNAQTEYKRIEKTNRITKFIKEGNSIEFHYRDNTTQLYTLRDLPYVFWKTLPISVLIAENQFILQSITSIRKKEVGQVTKQIRAAREKKNKYQHHINKLEIELANLDTILMIIDERKPVLTP